VNERAREMQLDDTGSGVWWVLVGTGESSLRLRIQTMNFPLVI
jgi:hypothetical protein